jgi:hypothetical protein
LSLLALLDFELKEFLQKPHRERDEHHASYVRDERHLQQLIEGKHITGYSASSKRAFKEEKTAHRQGSTPRTAGNNQMVKIAPNEEANLTTTHIGAEVAIRLRQ